ncbi:MAG: DUF262 domain-containing protein [Nitrospirae bacterium]|nr:DUF262 domain-containing protein [Nitrospirota bacterium]
MTELKEEILLSSNEEADGAIEQTDESSSEIKKPFDPTQIDITSKSLIIDSLIKRMKTNTIDINTEFQRQGNLWNKISQSRLIESLLVRIPLPAFYFDGSDDNNWKVVDGLQRLSTLKNFIIDKTLKLENLEYLTSFNNYGFDDLPLYLKRRIEESQVTTYIINPGTPANVKYNIFKRINTGGLVLYSQEIRHALNQGIPADFVKELSGLSEFHQATGYALQNKKRMEDRDFVMRFIAFYWGYDDYESDVDGYLNDKMASLSKITQNERDQLKKDFIKAMNAAYNIFGNDAFRKRASLDERRRPLNKSLFDAWSTNLARLAQDEIDTIVEKREIVKTRLIELINNNISFYNSITYATGGFNAVKTRMDVIKELIETIVYDEEFKT